MAANGQLEALGERNGLPFYKTNPSIRVGAAVSTRTRTTQVAKVGKAVLIDDGGNVLGKGSIAFMESTEVDKTQFVKLYVEGLRSITGLSKPGSAVCEIVYEQMQEKPNNDHIVLKYAFDKDKGITERTYRRGVRDLLEKEILFASQVEGMYFLNILYMFNGNRLHFIKSHYLASQTKSANEELGFSRGDR